jgi:methionyl-tRNA formyltransferase
MAKIVFAGTAEFSTVVLMALAEEHDVVHVFSQPDKPVGRKQVLEPTPIKLLCEKIDLKYSQPEKIADDDFWKNPPPFDFFITASYGQLLPESVLKVAKTDALNVHASLLPKHRGATPIQNAILSGDSVTGISIIRMVKKMDAGDIFLQQEVAILPMETSDELFDRLAPIGAKLVLQTLEIYPGLVPIPQDELQITHCRKITKSQGEIAWNMTAEQIYNQWRAFTSWPGIFTWWNGKRLKIVAIDKLEDDSMAEPGLIYVSDGDVVVHCGQNALVLKQIQLEGKTVVDARSFLKGNPDFVGSVLGT